MERCIARLDPASIYGRIKILSILTAVSCYFALHCFPVTTYGAETPVFTLDEAIEYALDNNEGIAAAREKVKEAEAGRTVARAKFFPYLSASASYTRLGKVPEIGLDIPEDMDVAGMMLPVLDPFGVPTGDMVPVGGLFEAMSEMMDFKMGSENIYVLRASLQYPLFTWWKITNAYKISSLSLDAAKEDLRRKENEIKLAVTESFLRIQLAGRGLELVRESLGQLEQHIKQAEDLYDAGKISKFDFLRARVQLSAVKVQVSQTENGLVLANDMLKNLLGIEIEKEVVIKGEIEYNSYNLSLTEATKVALENRPEIRTMNSTVEIAEKVLEIARAANKPSLVLAGNYDYKNPTGMGKEEWGTDWSATIALNFPLFQGGEILGKIGQAEAQLKQAKLGHKQLIKGINLEVKNAFLQMHSSQNLLASQKESIEEAKEALKIAQDRYLNGLITNLEYLDAQVSLSRAEMGYVQTLADYFIARARLEKAIGK